MTGEPAVEPTGGEETGSGANPPSALPSYGPPSYSQGYGRPAYGPGDGTGYGPGDGTGDGTGYGTGYGPGDGGYRGSGSGPGDGGYRLGYGQPGMRAAAADRERTIDVLKAAYGEGRLNEAEFESRTSRTMAAKTYGELEVIIADLPAGPFGPRGPRGPGYYPPAVPVTTNGLAVGSLVCSLIGLIMPLMLVPGLVMGHIARDQIRARDQRGDGFAVAGLVFGYVGIAFWVLIIALVVAHN